MKTQDGQGVNLPDEQLQVEHGFGRRSQFITDDELKRQIPAGDYTQTHPITIYTEALKNKHVIMSATVGPNPFAKSSGFTQPVQQSRAVNRFEGNVNFEQEARRTDFRDTHKDFAQFNPNLWNKEPEIEPFSEIQGRIIEVCKARSGNGLRGLRVMFRAMDRNRNNSLDPVEFKYAMRDYGVKISDLEVTAIVKYFDKNKDGKISFDEFLRAVRGDLNDRRKKLVHMAYSKLDKNGDGTVKLDDLLIAYNATQHPDFISGAKTERQIIEEFMQVWETHKKDGIITIEEFEDYYKDISASVDLDDYFELMIRNAWHILGGEGWCANTTN